MADDTYHVLCMPDNYGYTHSDYVIPVAFPRQQWLSQRASMLGYTHIACLVYDHAYYQLLKGSI